MLGLQTRASKLSFFSPVALCIMSHLHSKYSPELSPQLYNPIPHPVLGGFPVAVLLASFLCGVGIRKTTHMTDGYRQLGWEAACVGARVASLEETDRTSHSRKPPWMSGAESL